MDKKSYSLLELNTFIKRILALNFDQEIRVKAEILSLNIKRGHYYLNLIQKDPESNEIIAQLNAIIWSTDVSRIKKVNDDLDSYFIAGHEMLLSGIPVFHEKFGLSFKINGIDTSFTRGELDKKKEELFERIYAEGLHNINKSLMPPIAFKRLAIISSSTAAGYIDFINHISMNQFGLSFDIKLFESVMQGSNLENHFIEVLENIRINISGFDAVVIIRGGGSKVDLAGFDNYNLAHLLANFPLPVYTGIGHEIDISSLDLVAHKYFKTPTAVAEFFIGNNIQFLNSLSDHVIQIINVAGQTLIKYDHQLNTVMSGINRTAHHKIEKLIYQYEVLTKNIVQASQLSMNKLSYQLKLITEKILLLNPFEVLSKGYVLITQKGKKIKSVNDLYFDEITEAHFHDGTKVFKPVNSENGKK